MHVGVGTIPSRTCTSEIELKQCRIRDKIEYLSSYTRKNGIELLVEKKGIWKMRQNMFLLTTDDSKRILTNNRRGSRLLSWDNGEVQATPS